MSSIEFEKDGSGSNSEDEANLVDLQVCFSGTCRDGQHFDAVEGCGSRLALSECLQHVQTMQESR
jgi:hypothetical protein